MKKTLTYLLLAVFLCGLSNRTFSQNEPSIPCNQLPQRPNPPVAVNDFANVIDDGAQRQMENSLRAYWDSTSIAITVVTVQNMNSNEVSDYAFSIFRCWGVGSKETNRGVLVFMSLDDRKFWISTGYGMEGILPDVTCKDIWETNVKPLCKEGKYSDAMVEGVNQIFQRLGTMSWEERLEGIAAEKAADDKRKTEFQQTFLDVLLVLGILVAIVALIWVARDAARKRKLSKHITRMIETTRSEIDKAKNHIVGGLHEYQSQATWAKKEAEEHAVEARRSLSEAQKCVKDAEVNRRKNPDYAEEQTIRAQQLITKSFNNFSKIHSGLREKIKRFSNEAPKRLQAAQEEVKNNLSILSGYTKKGYRFSHYISEQQDFQRMLDDYQSKISDCEFQQQIYTNAETIERESKESINAVQEIISTQVSIGNNLTEKIQKGIQQQKEAEKQSGLINVYKKGYPESVWAKDEQRMQKLLRKLDIERLHKLHEEILLLNGMEKQEFAIAKSKYQELSDQIEEITTLSQKIQSIGPDQEKSKAMYKDVYTEVKEIVQLAMNKVKNSDVTLGTKSMAKEAQQKLQQAQLASSKTILDWVMLIVLLQSILDLAKDAVNGSEIDINDAEEGRARERRRKKEQEEEETRQRNRRNDSYNSYSSPYSSGSSDYSSGGSFGGFSGGSTGGGGGGGGW